MRQEIYHLRKSRNDPTDRDQKGSEPWTVRQKKDRDGHSQSLSQAPDLRGTDYLVNQVETEIFNREEREIQSSEIGELVMNYLKDLDQVAYVRFASIYREFKDVNTFLDELKKMLN